jgi:hypothetical protein
VESQSGYVTIAGEQKAAALSMEEGRLSLRVTDSEGSFGLAHPEDLELLQFRGSRNAFTLLGLQHKSSQARLGVGGTTTYTVRLALEDVLYTSEEEISGTTWLLYVEDLARILHVTGLQQTVALDEQGGVEISWFFRPAAAVILHCPRAGLELHVGQDMKTGGDPILGPSMHFRYAARLISDEELKLYSALKLLNRIRLFFSLVMGRVLGIDEVSLRLEDDEGKHDAKVHGLIPIARSDKPTERLVGFSSPEQLATMLDQWLVRFDEISEAVHLHMDGLEQRRLPLPLRFQIFVQALEALHRKTTAAAVTPIDVQTVSAVLREQGIPGDVVDRVGGVLAHAHEPGLRQRLKSYWDQFAAEIASLRPDARRNEFVGRVAATRNHFAHRTDKDAQVLERGDLWDHTETVKAIAHMALVGEIGGDVAGLGKAMLNRRFAEYVLRTGRRPARNLQYSRDGL